jgi:hypothetical protein
MANLTDQDIDLAVTVEIAEAQVASRPKAGRFDFFPKDRLGVGGL